MAIPKNKLQENPLLTLSPKFIDGYSQPMFTVPQIAKMFGISESTATKAISRLSHVQGLDALIGRKLVPMFDLGTVLTFMFTRYSEDYLSPVRNFVARRIGDLVTSGFTSIREAHLEPRYMRGIIQEVLGIKYEEIVATRYRANDPKGGSVLQGSLLTKENLAKPESYIRREELISIKAIDLAIFLLAKHLDVDVDELFKGLSMTPVDLPED